MSIETTVIRHIAPLTKIDKEQITPSDDLRLRLGLDELDLVELTIDIEGEVGYSLSDEEVAKLNTVQELIDYVEKSAVVPA